MKNIIRKYDNVFVLGVIIIITTAISYNFNIGANDELWNFSNIYKMTNGYEIYKDINVIITPLFFYIGKLLFEIFGANYMTMRTLQTVLIYTLLFFSIYQLFKKLKINKLNSILYTLIIASICIFKVVDGSYNMLAISFVIIGIIIEIKNKNNKTSLNIIQGIIMFLIFMSKQNIGALYIFGFITYKIIDNKNIKETIRSICIPLLSSGILLIIYLSYLYINDNLYNFINYTILGIGEFANKNIKGQTSNVIMILSQVIILIIFLIIVKNRKNMFLEEQISNIRLIGVISIFTNLIAYPIINVAHTLIGSLIFEIFLCYILDFTIFRELLNGKKTNIIKKLIIMLIVLMFITLNIINNFNYINNFYKDKNSPYYGTIIPKETKEDISTICLYIKQENEKGIDVKIISYYSNLYMNVLNRNNSDFDLPFYGNMGKDGENGMIEKIKQLKDTKILILKEEDKVYQESKKVMNYIKENLEYEGEINRFSIYINK